MENFKERERERRKEKRKKEKKYICCVSHYIIMREVTTPFFHLLFVWRMLSKLIEYNCGSLLVLQNTSTLLWCMHVTLWPYGYTEEVFELHGDFWNISNCYSGWLHSHFI